MPAPDLGDPEHEDGWSSCEGTGREEGGTEMGSQSMGWSVSSASQQKPKSQSSQKERKSMSRVRGGHGRSHVET